MKILITPDPFLRRVAHPITTLTPDTIKEVKNMITILKNASDPEGVGLAATQVGIDKRIFIILGDDKKPSIFINPKITKSSKQMISDVYKTDSKRWLEGCLSIPHIWGFVNRPYSVTFNFQTFDPDSNNPKLISQTKTFTDIESSYVQHERDHLDGVLFTDHILKQDGTIYQETRQGLTPVKL